MTAIRPRRIGPWGIGELARRIAIWAGVAIYAVVVIRLAMLGEWTGLLGFSAFPVVGAIILTSRPRNGVGWYLWGVGMYWLVCGWTLNPQVNAAVPAWLESLAWALAGPFWVLLPIVGLLFPTGRIETRLGRVLAWLLVAFAALSAVGGLATADVLESGRANPFGLPAPAWLEVVFDTVVFPSVVVVYIGIVVDLRRRWRTADPATRAQYRWFFAGLCVAAGVISLVALSSLLPPIAEFLDTAAAVVVAILLLNLVPISIGIAVTRHGLYEIGRVISRTVSYLLVTALAVGVYALVVTSVSWWLPGLPALGVALATLAAAALCWPALRWVQRRLDRQFDRERYDAEKVVDAFGRRLRDGADPASTAPELVATVEQALQPASVGLWTPPGRTS